MKEGVSEAASRLRAILADAGISSLRVGIVLGSGLGEAAPGLEDEVEIPFAGIPGWPPSAVPGHRGVLRCGRRYGEGVWVQLGRPHFYEGLGMREVTFPVRLMAELGVRNLFLSNAAGGLNPAFEKGVLMLVRDHINLMGENPLRGVRDLSGNPAFLDVSDLYRESIGDALVERARAAGWPLAEGTLVGVAGPSYETGAELRFLRLVGGDAVSMSLVPEALVARYLGMEVTGVCVITNTWDLRKPHPVSHGEVLETSRQACGLLREVIDCWMELVLG